MEALSPLLPVPIHGSLYIAQPYENPFGSLLGLYVVLKNPEKGVLIKLAGKVTPNPATGQLTTTFQGNPPVAFSHFNFHFREGQQAPLISPPACGTYTTQAELTPFSEPASILTDFSSFQITKGFDGGPCPAGVPFAPQIQAGMLNNNAGNFSPFYLHLTRSDADAGISSFSTTMPPGLSGVIAGIPYCPEADIALARTKSGAGEEAAPSCPSSSLLGHTLVGTGVGAVLAYTPGKLYLAGPYNGDPFSLVSVTSAVVGPFDLGTVVIRFGLAHRSAHSAGLSRPHSLRTDPHDHPGHRRPRARHPRLHRPPQLHDQPDQLRSDGDSKHPEQQSQAELDGLLALSGDELLEPEVRPEILGLDDGKTSKANGAEPAREAHLPERRRWAPTRTSRRSKSNSQAAALAPDDAAEGVHGQAVRSKPRRRARRHRIIGHARSCTRRCCRYRWPAPRSSSPTAAKRSRACDGAAGLRRHDRSRRHDVHHKRHHQHDVQDVPDQPFTSFELTLPEGPYSALAANGNLCAQEADHAQ